MTCAHLSPKSGTLLSDRDNARLKTLKDVLCCTLMGREFRSAVSDGMKEFR